ncbi:DNA-directed DNA polymerase alpha subunit pol12 [Elasticomyces elasticus]|nr:DNA-directed DNA polymerase alpha subunit pol12 [Elasticomyces elasticus]
MADNEVELNELFARPSTQLAPEVLGEFQSILRLHSISPQELFYKWESYSIKMGANTMLDYNTARDFKKDIQDALERESRGKLHVQSASKRNVAPTPRGASNGDVFGMLDGLVANTPKAQVSSRIKRKSEFGTPTPKVVKNNILSSPGEVKASKSAKNDAGNNLPTTGFTDRVNGGQVIESLNSHITVPTDKRISVHEARVKLKANTELSKFAYKTMAIKLSEASEILDDRIDEFTTVIQAHHALSDAAFGNPASQSTAEIVAVGRIASDSSEGKLNAASLVLEVSRRTGAGSRIPLRMEEVHYDFFPGKIVALRGINATGEYFSVSEILPVPLLNPPASMPDEIDVHNARLQDPASQHPDTPPLSIMIASGPYTTDADLDFAPLHTLLERAAESTADTLVLNGPFLDIEHPLLASGDFESYLPADAKIDPDQATLTDVFRILISAPLDRLVQQIPGITIILVPSVRDAVIKHVAYPQDRLPRRELALPKQVSVVTNPITLSINEIVVGMSSQDVLYELRQDNVVTGRGRQEDLLARLAGQLIEQRHFFPVYPPLSRSALPAPTQIAGLDAKEEKRVASGASLDLGYLKLGEWLNVRPDVLVTPSVLTPFAKVVQSVLVINPGTLSKKRGPGTYAHLTVQPRSVSEEEREDGDVIGHQLYERARCDIVRI